MKQIITKCGQTVFVDDQFAPIFKHYIWHVRKGRVMRWKGSREIYMSRLVMKMNPVTDRNLTVLFRDGNYLNVTTKNLYIATKAQAGQGQARNNGIYSKYLGVCFEKSGKRVKRWIAVTNINGVKIRIGYYHTEDMAAVAYNLFVIKYLGKRAVLNKVKGMEHYYDKRTS